MGNLKGLLKPLEGYSMPVSCPIAQAPSPEPYRMRHYENFTVDFEMDYEAVKDDLPTPLEFEGDVPRATFSMSDFWSNTGQFLEATIMWHVLYEGKKYLYIPYILVDSESAMANGRELYGNQKKLAKIKMWHEVNVWGCNIERFGHRLLVATVRPEINTKKLPDEENIPIVNCKRIGHCSGEGFDVCQLVAQDNPAAPIVDTDGLIDEWSGQASIDFPDASQEDTWYHNRPTKILGGTFGHYNSVCGKSWVLHDYLKNN